MQYVLPKCRKAFTRLHSVTSKNIIAVKTPNAKHENIKFEEKATTLRSINVHFLKLLDYILSNFYVLEALKHF
jgi:hypothetical protein